MLNRLVQALVESPNEAADTVLLEALRVGSEAENGIALDALIRRQTVRGLAGVISRYTSLPEIHQRRILDQIRSFHHALRECGRSDDAELRLCAMKLIALGRQGKLAYVLTENLHDPDERLSKAAVEAIVALARWVSTESRALHRAAIDDTGESAHRNQVYSSLMENRPEIEAAVSRALDLHRGRYGQELLRAALLLCDSPESRTLAILHTTKHGGQSPMVRRLQQPPASEHVEAFLLGASHGGLRSHFGMVFSHITEAPVLDALLRKTHWLKDHQLQLCMHQVSRGPWWGEAELLHDLERRPPEDSCQIAEWLAVSGMHDVMQDQRMLKLMDHARDDVHARLRLLRIAMHRKRGASVQFIRAVLADADERLARLAAREIVRRRPADFENILLQLMTTAPESVRRVISRSIGHVGFDQFWQRFDRMDRQTRRQAGRAMLKLLPDGIQRLSRRLGSDPIEQRVKAMQIVQELELAPVLRTVIIPLCNHPSPRVRSKAVSVVGEIPGGAPDLLLEKAVNDSDSRVRANAIEMLELNRSADAVPLLATRARSSHSRERANAIKAMHSMRVSTASNALLGMLRDQRPDHRISALWALRQIGWWQMLNEVGRLAKEDTNLRVRRYALGVLKNVVDLMQTRKAG
jgi:HEAT repeat protein